MRTCVILPTLNEEEALPKVIQDIRELDITDLDIVVVDGGSTDRTKEIAEELADYSLLLDCRGKGLQIMCARTWIVPLYTYSYFIMIDSDGSYSANFIDLAYHTLKENEAIDVVVGKRVTDKSSMSLGHKVGNKALSLLASFLYAHSIKDVCSGAWAFKEEALRSLYLVAEGFDLEANLWAEVCKRKFGIAQVPVTYSKRIGKSKLKFWNAAIIAWRLIERRFNR